MQLEFRMKCKGYCNEQKVQILNDWGVLYTEPVYVNFVDSVNQVCLEKTNNEMYILNLMDTFNDRWDTGSYLTILGEYGNVFYKGYMIDKSRETFPLSLHYPIRKNSEWKVTNNAQGSWMQTTYSDDSWSTETLGSVTGTYSGTQYFRKQFIGIEGLAAYELRMNYRYGVVVYVSGNEVYRDNMPSGAVTADTHASSQYESVSYRGFIRPSLDIAQSGVLAIELHFTQDASSTTVDFDAFMAAITPSAVNSDCFVYPYELSITATPSLAYGVAGIFDFDRTSSLTYRESEELTVKFTVNNPVHPYVNGIRYYTNSATNNIRSGVFSGSSDDESYTDYIGIVEDSFQSSTYNFFYGYWGISTYKHLKLTVTEKSDAAIYIFEFQPLTCNVTLPASIPFKSTTYSFYSNLEEVLIASTLFGISNCTISPELPSGVTLNPATCVISGVSTEETTSTQYTLSSHVGSTVISGTFTLSTPVCSGSVIQILRTYKSGASNEEFSIVNAETEEVLYSVTVSSGQPDNEDWTTRICVNANRIGVDVSSFGRYWIENSYLYVQVILSTGSTETLLRARYDTHLGLSTSYYVAVNLPIHPFEEWHYYTAGDVPASWYNAETSGWASASKGHFTAFTNRVQLYKKTFSIASLENIAGFMVSVQYQYGCAIYMNGIEVFKNGITEVSATATISNIYPSLGFHSVTLPVKTMKIDDEPAVNYLQSGSNTIAIALIANSDTTVDSTFDAALMLLGNNEYSRVYDYTTTRDGGFNEVGSVFSNCYTNYASSSTCNDNSVTITFNNDRREWVSSALIQVYFDEADTYPHKFSVFAKNQADLEWTSLGSYENLGWSLSGQTKKVWLKNNKPYNQYKFANFGTGDSTSCPWKLSRIDLLSDNLNVNIPELTYTELNPFVNIEMAEAYPNSNSYFEFSVNPALPDGLHICPVSGMIYGTATQGREMQTYTVSARKATGEATSAQLSFDVEVCTGGRSLITVRMKVDSYPSENTYELYKGRGDSGDLIASVDMMPVSNSLYYLDSCLNDDIYTFYAIDSYGDGWDITTGYMLTVDVGATIFEVKGVPSGPKPVRMPTSFSSYLPFQINYSEWMVAKVSSAPAGWTAVSYSGSEFQAMKAAEIGTNEYITTYIRKSFDIPNLDDYQVLNVRVLYEGGVAAYFNGKLVARFNLEQDFKENTLAMSIHDTQTFSSFHIILPTMGAVVGANVLAFEVHAAPDSSSPVIFDATGIFGVENCSLVLDTFSSITGSTLYGKDVQDLFKFEIGQLGQIDTAPGNTIGWTVENLEGTVFNSFGLLAASLTSLSYSLEGTQNEGEENLNMFSAVDIYVYSREIMRQDSPLNYLPFKNFRWVVDSRGPANLQLQSFLFYYCKASGEVCEGDGEYPSVGEGQFSPAMCDYGFTGYKYRECHDGVLGEVFTEYCRYKIPSELEYPSRTVEVVKDVEMKPLVPTYKELITSFRINKALPRGLKFDNVTGTISGTPEEEFTLGEFTIVGENPVGAVQTIINLSVRKGRCISDGNFPTTPVDEEAVYDCALLGSFVGTQKRFCKLGATDGEWTRISGMCVSIVTLVLIIVVAIVVVLILVFLLIRVTRRRKAVHGVKASSKTSASPKKNNKEKATKTNKVKI